MKRIMILLWLALFSAHAWAAGQLEPLRAGARVAFLGIGFVDWSTEGAYFGVRDDQTARVVLLENAVRERLLAEGFTIVTNAPIAAKLNGIANPGDCYGCDVRLAGELDADYVVVGEVQKVSNLVLSMQLVMRDVPSGTMVRGLSVDFRSNTDQSWLRGLRYIFDNHFFKS